MNIKRAILVRNKTRLEFLTERFNSKDQAKFYIEHSGGDFHDYELEHDHFYRSWDKLQLELSRVIKIKTLDRSFIPSYLFSKDELVIVVGQDGLVANTAKYVDDIPIIAVNPDPGRYDGVLLPFDINSCITATKAVLNDKYRFTSVTMAEAKLNDGQSLLAFNDLFIGPTTHVSARYRITYSQVSENHSSSGLIVSTGAGSTGWLSSLFNMANGINRFFTGTQAAAQNSIPLDTSYLVFIVREPFLSKTSAVNLTAGVITNEYRLELESFMPNNGIIFSDGIEADHMKFNSGAIATIGIAKQKAKLVQPVS